MATDYKALLDMLNPKKEEEQLFSPINPTQEQLSALVQPESTPAVEEPVAIQAPARSIPKSKPVTQKEANPFMEGVPSIDSVMARLPKSDQAGISQLPEDGSLKPAPMSKSEALLAEYQKMLGRDQEDLKAARDRDRMLKVGGALGDALATYLNAQSQMNVKAPGVQVQQGAGLGRVADMFATAPEIASDISERRKQLLDQYKQMTSGEEAKLDRALKERQVAAYEAQTRAQARKAEREASKEATKEEKPTIGEQTVDKEFAKKYNEWRTGGKADYEENKKIFDEAINALKKGEVSTGTLSGIGARVPGIRTETRQLETRVRKGLNNMLRATLGAQFTQEEGERIFQQTFDPAAPPEENIKNMQTELSKIEKRARDLEQQGQYFSKQKTLSGFEAPAMQSQEQALSPKDQQALDWANSNPNDPRSAQIKRRLGR